MISRIGQYLRDYYFKPQFTDHKPRKSKQHMINVFTYKGEFASKERSEFFDEAYGEILFDIFMAWCNTQTSDVNEREHLYRTVLALGSVKEKMVGYETFGKNIPYLYESREAETEEDETNGEESSDNTD